MVEGIKCQGSTYMQEKMFVEKSPEEVWPTLTYHLRGADYHIVPM